MFVVDLQNQSVSQSPMCTESVSLLAIFCSTAEGARPQIYGMRSISRTYASQRGWLYLLKPPLTPPPTWVSSYNTGPALWLGMVLLIKAAEASAPPSFSAGAVEAGEGSGYNGRSNAAVEDLEYAALAERTLGKFGPYLVDVSILVLNFGAVMSYVILVGGLTTSLLSGTKVQRVL